MRLVLQRVLSAAANLDGEPVAAIGPGLVAYLGFGRGDDRETAVALAAKTVHLRIFDHGERKFGRSLLEVGGEVLTVSQFTLLADTSRGRRPDFSRAAVPQLARALYGAFGDALESLGVARVARAPFASRLVLEVANWGPFTVVLEAGEAGSPTGDGRAAGQR